RARARGARLARQPGRTRGGRRHARRRPGRSAHARRPLPGHPQDGGGGVEPGPRPRAGGRPDPGLAGIPEEMTGPMTSSRGFFLKSSGLALVAFGAAPRALVRSVYAAEGGRRRKTLVVVFQRGAMDGLNVVAPYGDAIYRRMRPTIALPSPRGGGKDAALDL